MAWTPEEFAEQMKEAIKPKIRNDLPIKNVYEDEELIHQRLDDLLCDMLSQLGYDEGAEIFKKADKWYS